MPCTAARAPIPWQMPALQLDTDERRVVLVGAYEPICTHGVTSESSHAIGPIADYQVGGLPIRIRIEYVSAMQRISVAAHVLRTEVFDADDLICHSTFPS